MHRLSQNELDGLTENAAVLESDGLGPKVLKLTDGSFLKLFRKRPRLSSEALRPYARRFAENASALQRLGFISPQIIQVYALSGPINATAVHYWPLPGETLRQVLSHSAVEERRHLVERFGELLAKLHEAGVYFRSVHLGNVLLLPDGQFGLIDLADMRIGRFALSLGKRQRNLKHMQRYAEDSRWLFEEYRGALRSGYQKLAARKALQLFPD
ncbi:lipopolysaccharide kinase InaA family protein [Pseudomonas benzenivorans]|uniref:Lipopolysaccharide kinase InaA family protein n=1 Tax=Pseudomonas benzenivorans TaxID=556533 RepID=A0ABZ0PXH7_9PSED|nr:lipopolysaccharide kinase InaA family protein [Pseudomonas benzenivorans]WPC05631.1 lipopolysaccharide kinase InaA family protein [Pseudomonas benzenivorans]